VIRHVKRCFFVVQCPDLAGTDPPLPMSYLVYANTSRLIAQWSCRASSDVLVAATNEVFCTPYDRARLATAQTAITREHPPAPAPHDAAEAASPGAVTQAPASPQPIAPTPLPPASVRAAIAESMAAPPTSPPSAIRC